MSSGPAKLLEESIREINSIDVVTESDSITLAEAIKGIRQAFGAGILTPECFTREQIRKGLIAYWGASMPAHAKAYDEMLEAIEKASP